MAQTARYEWGTSSRVHSLIVDRSIELYPSSTSSFNTPSINSNSGSTVMNHNSTLPSLYLMNGYNTNTSSTKSRLPMSHSNDYYAKKRIEELHERMDDIQISNFLQFINYHLSSKMNADKPCINDLAKDFSNGVILIDLIEVLSSTQLNRERGVTRIHSLANVQRVLDYLKLRTQHLDIAASEIVSGNRKQILALLWTIMKTFDFPAFRIDNKNCYSEKTLLGYGQDRSIVLNWTNSILKQSQTTHDIYIRDFYLQTWIPNDYLPRIIKYLIPLSVKYLTIICLEYMKKLNGFTSYNQESFELCMTISNYCFNTLTNIDFNDKTETSLFKYFTELQQNIVMIFKTNNVAKVIQHNPYAKQVVNTIAKTRTERSAPINSCNQHYLICIGNDSPTVPQPMPISPPEVVSGHATTHSPPNCIDSSPNAPVNEEPSLLGSDSKNGSVEIINTPDTSGTVLHLDPSIPDSGIKHADVRDPESTGSNNLDASTEQYLVQNDGSDSNEINHMKQEETVNGHGHLGAHLPLEELPQVINITAVDSRDTQSNNLKSDTNIDHPQPLDHNVKPDTLNGQLEKPNAELELIPTKFDDNNIEVVNNPSSVSYKENLKPLTMTKEPLCLIDEVRVHSPMIPEEESEETVITKQLLTEPLLNNLSDPVLDTSLKSFEPSIEQTSLTLNLFNENSKNGSENDTSIINLTKSPDENSQSINASEQLTLDTVQQHEECEENVSNKSSPMIDEHNEQSDTGTEGSPTYLPSDEKHAETEPTIITYKPVEQYLENAFSNIISGTLEQFELKDESICISSMDSTGSVHDLEQSIAGYSKEDQTASCVEDPPIVTKVEDLNVSDGSSDLRTQQSTDTRPLHTINTHPKSDLSDDEPITHKAPIKDEEQSTNDNEHSGPNITQQQGFENMATNEKLFTVDEKSEQNNNEIEKSVPSKVINGNVTETSSVAKHSNISAKESPLVSVISNNIEQSSGEKSSNTDDSSFELLLNGKTTPENSNNQTNSSLIGLEDSKVQEQFAPDVIHDVEKVHNEVSQRWTGSYSVASQNKFDKVSAEHNYSTTNSGHVESSAFINQANVKITKEKNENLQAVRSKFDETRSSSNQYNNAPPMNAQKVKERKPYAKKHLRTSELSDEKAILPSTEKHSSVVLSANLEKPTVVESLLPIKLDDAIDESVPKIENNVPIIKTSTTPKRSSRKQRNCLNSNQQSPEKQQQKVTIEQSKRQEESAVKHEPLLTVVSTPSSSKLQSESNKPKCATETKEHLNESAEKQNPAKTTLVKSSDSSQAATYKQQTSIDDTASNENRSRTSTKANEQRATKSNKQKNRNSTAPTKDTIPSSCNNSNHDEQVEIQALSSNPSKATSEPKESNGNSKRKALNRTPAADLSTKKDKSHDSSALPLPKSKRETNTVNKTPSLTTVETETSTTCCNTFVKIKIFIQNRKVLALSCFIVLICFCLSILIISRSDQ